MFVNRVFIRGYRGIRELEFEASRINVVVGPNNTGKSSILEAIGLATTVPSGFKDLLGNSALGYLVENRGYDPRYLIHMSENSVSIEIKAQENEYRLILEYLRNLPRDVRGLLIRDYFGESMLKDTLKETMKTESLDFYIKLKEALEDLSLSISRRLNLNLEEIKELQSRTLRSIAPIGDQLRFLQKALT